MMLLMCFMRFLKEQAIKEKTGGGLGRGLGTRPYIARIESRSQCANTTPHGPVHEQEYCGKDALLSDLYSVREGA